MASLTPYAEMLICLTNAGATNMEAHPSGYKFNYGGRSMGASVFPTNTKAFGRVIIHIHGGNGEMIHWVDEDPLRRLTQILGLL